MAIYNSHLFDNASGSVGNVTLCRFRKQNVAKAKIKFKRKRQSPAQQVEQARFSTLSELARAFRQAIRAGFPEKSLSEARATFMGINRKAVDIDEATLASTIHLDRVNCSSGNLTPPSAKVSIRQEDGLVRTTWQRQPLSPVAKDGDDITLVLLDPAKKKTRVYPLGKRGTPGEKTFSLHKDFNPGSTVAYAFAHSSINTRASRSVFIEVSRE